MIESMHETHPLLGFKVDQRPDAPSVAVIGFQTSKGKFHFAVTNEFFEQLAVESEDAAEFEEAATVTPTIGDFQ